MANFVDLMIAKSFDLLFRSHEIRPPDPEPMEDLCTILPIQIQEEL